MRLPQEALNFRQQHNLLSDIALSRINITAWLYETKSGAQLVRVNPNVPIDDIIKEIGRPANTSDAETGLHSEGIAAEWFRTQRDVKQVLQIFTERIPCTEGKPGRGRSNCQGLLTTYYKGVPVFYYDSPASIGAVADNLKNAYEISR